MLGQYKQFATSIIACSLEYFLCCSFNYTTVVKVAKLSQTSLFRGNSNCLPNRDLYCSNKLHTNIIFKGFQSINVNDISSQTANQCGPAVQGQSGAQIRRCSKWSLQNCLNSAGGKVPPAFLKCVLLHT